MKSLRKRSIAISLVLAGASTGCSDSVLEPPLAMRDVYNSPAECHADWGDEAINCEGTIEQVAEGTPGATRSSTGAYYMPRYYGPYYRVGQRPTYTTTSTGQRVPLGNRATSTRTVNSGGRSAGSRSSSSSRGGFGSSGRSSGASS
jgi:uncharacterized membrane protein YgcG